MRSPRCHRLIAATFFSALVASVYVQAETQQTFVTPQTDTRSEITLNLYSPWPAAPSRQLISGLHGDTDSAARIERINIVSIFDDDTQSETSYIPLEDQYAKEEGEDAITYSIASDILQRRESRVLCDELSDLLSRGPTYFPQLSAFDWTAPEQIPDNLVKALSEFPALNLTIETWSSFPPSPVVRSARVFSNSIELGDDKEFFLRVQRGIQGSPNLRSLQLRFEDTGCLRADYTTEFSTSDPGVFPPLEELKLQGFLVTPQDMEYWRDAMDWSHVRILELGDMTTSGVFLAELTPAAEYLPSLEVLRIAMLPLPSDPKEKTELESAVKGFLRSVRKDSLVELELVGPHHDFVEDASTIAGPRLKYLKLHEPETSWGKQREMMTIPRLLEVSAAFPGLEHLYIDINISQNHTWPADMVDALRSETVFPNLKSLSLSSLLGYDLPVWEHYIPSKRLTFDTDHQALIDQLSSRTTLQKIDILAGFLNHQPGMCMSKPWVRWVATRDSEGVFVVEGSGPARDRDETLEPDYMRFN